MKKLAVSVFMLCFSSFGSDFITGLPNGSFVGDGYWSDNYGEEGDYEASLIIDKENQLTINYQWDGEERSVTLLFWFTEEGSFDVSYQGEKVGSGYCEGDECHYDIEIDDAYYGEELYFVCGGNLLKSGYREKDGRIIYWEEELYPIELIPVELPPVPPLMPPSIAPIQIDPIDHVPPTPR